MCQETVCSAPTSRALRGAIGSARLAWASERATPVQSLVLAVPRSATSRASYTVRLYRRDPFDARRAAHPLYRPFTVTDGALAVPGLDLSADGSLLAYNDGRYRVHLVDLRTSADRVLGAGMAPRFSPDGRYLAYVAVPGQPLPGLGPHGDGVMLDDLRAGAVRRIAQPRGTLLSSVTSSTRRNPPARGRSSRPPRCP